MDGFVKKLFSSKLSKPVVLLMAIFFLPAVSFATPQNLTVSVSDSNPVPGTTMSVTVVVCDNEPWANNRLRIMAGFVSGGGQTSFSNCGTAGQYLFVSSGISGHIAAGPGMYDIGSGATGVGDVYPSYTNGASPSCPSQSVTAVWSVYVDGNYLTAGTYSLVVAAGMDYINCTNGNGLVYAYTDVQIPLPPPNITLSKRAESAAPAPGALVLYTVDYTVVNTNNFTITDTIPSGMSFVAISPGGTNSGGNLSWNLGNISSQVTGFIWYLVQVDPGTAAGTVITNTAGGTSDDITTPVTSSAAATVTAVHLTLNKSQSSSSVAITDTVTYSLSWSPDGLNFQWFDTYNNVTAGSNTSGAQVTWGFDNSTYSVVPSGGGSGTWQVASDATGNHYIISNTPYQSSGGQYPLLMRDGPGLNLCVTFIVEGDIQIPGTATGAVSNTADAHMVLAYSVNGGVTQAYMAALSIDGSPNSLFIQRNNGTIVNQYGTNSIPVSIQPGQWYTLKVQVEPSGSSLNFYVKYWIRGTAEPSGWVFQWTDSSPFACAQPWKQGWQVDATAGTNWYSNLKVLGPGPVFNPIITDIADSQLSYLGSNATTATGAPSLSWSIPGTFLGQTSPLNWWARVSCPGPITNLFSMSAVGIPVTTSNSVALSVTGSCITPTHTFTPTITNSYTPTDTPTYTPTHTPTPTITNSYTPTTTPAPGTPTPTPTCYATLFLFSDTYDTSASLGNYTYWGDHFITQTAASSGYAVTGGELQVAPSSEKYTFAMVDNALFSESLSDYTVETDMKVDGMGSQGIFGILFRSIGANDQAYMFQFNSNTSRWEIEKRRKLGGSDAFEYVATNSTIPDMPTGVWIHLKAIVGPGNSFTCYVNFNDGVGDRLVFDGVSDTLATPHYSNGTVGLRVYGVSTLNPCHVDNFRAYACGELPTPSATPTATLTLTPTSTATVTETPTHTPTPPPAVPTPPGLNVWPNPFDPKYAVDGLLKVYKVPGGSCMCIYSLTGELVVQVPASGEWIYWNGTNNYNVPVSSGIYYYVIQDKCPGGATLLKGKLLVIMTEKPNISPIGILTK
jgi:hypothetical protein